MSRSLSPPTVALPEVPNAPPLRTKLLPFDTPPQSPFAPVDLPRLPSPSRKGAFTSTWTRSTHIIPAALPRTTADVPCFPWPLEFGPAHTEAVKLAAESLIDTRRQHLLRPARAEEKSRKQLWISLDRYANTNATQEYTNSNGKQPLTLLFLHAVGFPKEIWEPTLLSLITRVEKDASVHLAEIWTWQAVTHGDSALLNASSLGGVYDWADNARDVLNFLVHYLPPSSSRLDDLPIHLPPVSPLISSARKGQGLSDRTLIAVGHSFGGASSILAACQMPFLFSSLILVDPILESVPIDANPRLVHGAVRRRSIWSSREEAHTSLASNPFFASWDPAVLETYVQHGICPAPGGGVQLKTPAIQEATTFADCWSPGDAFRLLPNLSETVELRWIMPDLKKSWFLPDHAAGGEFARRRVWLRRTNASNVVLDGVGHLITQEAPDRLAEELCAFLWKKHGRSVLDESPMPGGRL